MKKLSVFLMFIVLLFAACSNSSGDTDSDQELDKDDQVVTDNPEDDEKEDADEKADVETDQSEDSAETDDEENTENKQEENKDQSAEDQLKELGLQIFAAQKDEDYDFLEGILSKGSTLNKASNTFSFDDVAYPHEQEFVQDDEGNIEYRYIHEEDADTIIVGFAVTNYETESSVTIDFQFVRENGEWKMNDMDMNA